jgi:hypothetical protein
MNQPHPPPGPWNTSGWPAPQAQGWAGAPPPPPEGWPGQPYPPNYVGAAWNPPPQWPPAAPPKHRGPWRPLLVVGAALVAVMVVVGVVRVVVHSRRART